MREREVELAVIGGGPAGMAAALAACRAGLHDVVILERHNELGGILRQCIHGGFGLSYYGREMTGPEYAEYYAAGLADHPGLGVELQTFVTGLSAGREIETVGAGHGVTRWRAGAVILAMGCRERPRGAVNIPGSRPAGVYTAGTVQELINLRGYLPGRKAVIVGSGDIGLIMARRLTLEGAEVRAVLELMPYPGGLTRNLVQCLHDYWIPLHLGRTVTRIEGRDRVSGVAASETDGKGRPKPGTEVFYPCDLVVLSVGLIPEIELARQAGLELDPATGGPLVDEGMQTSVPGIFACGNVLHVHDLVDDVTSESESAGRAAARYLLGREDDTPGTPIAFSGNIRSAVPQRIDPGRAARLYLRVREPQRLAVLSCGGTVIRRFGTVKPAESIRLELPPGKLVPDADGRIVLTLEGETVTARDDAGDRPAAGKKILTCIVCPTGCRLEAGIVGGEVVVSGAGCERGVEYARTELLAPTRTLFTTVAVEGGGPPLPVRTAAPIPKGSLERAMEELRRFVVKHPVKMGQIVLDDVAGTGTSVVAGKTLGGASPLEPV